MLIHLYLRACPNKRKKQGGKDNGIGYRAPRCILWMSKQRNDRNGSLRQLKLNCWAEYSHVSFLSNFSSEYCYLFKWRTGNCVVPNVLERVPTESQFQKNLCRRVNTWYDAPIMIWKKSTTHDTQNFRNQRKPWTSPSPCKINLWTLRLRRIHPPDPSFLGVIL